MKQNFFTLLAFALFITAIAFARPDGKGKGIDVKNIDNSVRPDSDFYQYAVGSWLKNNTIPDDQASWGSFEILNEQNANVLSELLESAANNTASKKGSPMQKAGDFYFIGMDTVKIDADGYKPIIPILKSISSVKTKEDLYKLFAYFHWSVGKTFFNFLTAADAKNSSTNIAIFQQGGIGLPDRDYYLKDDARSLKIREKYLAHIINMFKLIDMNEADAKDYADKVVALETRLAKASISKVDLRDPVKNYNKMTFAQLKALSTDIDWDLYFQCLKINPPVEFDVNQPDFIKEIGAIMKEMQPSEFQPYLKWLLMRSTALYLSSDFVKERYSFYLKTLYGFKVMSPRWKTVKNTVNSSLGEIVGELFVSKTFPPEAKQKAKSIVDNLLLSLAERIKKLDWMSESTKQAALVKLAAITVKIGYPDKWKDYSKVKISRDASYFENFMHVREFHIEEELSKIGKPVDKGEWELLPQTTNAYYEPTKNEIVFPAAILQPPFFDYNLDDAVNYGAMGVVIGHEVTHGFDDEGSQFDADGNLKNWWSEEDAVKFKERGQVLINQFNSFEILDSLTVNGELTQGENIADLGGLNVSFTAFKKTEQFTKGELIDGFTPAQRFFLSYAQIWKSNFRDEYSRVLIKTAPHSPNKFRVNGPLMNIPEFWEAFNVKPGDPMRRPEDKLVKIW